MIFSLYFPVRTVENNKFMIISEILNHLGCKHQFKAINFCSKAIKREFPMFYLEKSIVWRMLELILNVYWKFSNVFMFYFNVFDIYSCLIYNRAIFHDQKSNSNTFSLYFYFFSTLKTHCSDKFSRFRENLSCEISYPNIVYFSLRFFHSS